MPFKKHDHNDIVSAVKKLDAENYCDSKVIEVNFHEITNDGLDCIKNGSPEVRVFNAVPAEEDVESELRSMMEPTLGKAGFKAGISGCMKRRLFKVEKVDKKNKRFTRASNEQPNDDFVETLKLIAASNGDESILSPKAWKEFTRRKVVKAVKRKSFNVVKGSNYASKFVKPEADLTEEMLRSGSWETTKFKPYNFTSLGANVGGGHLHPLMKSKGFH